MPLSRPVFAVIVVLFAAVPSTAAAQSTASTLTLSAAGKRALKQSSVTLSTGKLSVGKTTVSSSATLALNGTLRFKSGRRSVSATALTLTVGRTASYVSARLGKKSVRLLTVTPTRPTQLEPASGAVTLKDARIALTAPAAKALRSALKLKRTPSTKTLGTLNVSVSPAPAAPGPSPAPITQPAPGPTTPAPSDDPPPPDTGTSIDVPPGSCNPARMSATPVGSVDWFSCDLAGSNDLRSWTRYVLAGPSFGCSPQPPSIIASNGAARLLSNSAYDHRFSIVQVTNGIGDSYTLHLGGTITYSMPAHGIDEQITNLEIEVDAGGLTGRVLADGRSADRNGVSCVSSPEQYADEPVMDLELSPGPGNTVRAQAKVAAPIGRLGGGQYPAGQPWGTFTFTAPAR